MHLHEAFGRRRTEAHSYAATLAALYLMDMESEAEITKRLILKIIQAYGRRLEGKTRLFKTYYYAHLEYFKATGRTLTDGTIVHMPHGPGIDDHDPILRALEKEQRIKETRSAVPYIDFVYDLLVEIPFEASAEDEAIRKAVKITTGLSAKQLSDMTHVSSHSWKRTTDGRLMDICIDVVSEGELEQIKKRLEAARKIAKAFNA